MSLEQELHDARKAGSTIAEIGAFRREVTRLEELLKSEVDCHNTTENELVRCKQILDDDNKLIFELRTSVESLENRLEQAASEQLKLAELFAEADAKYGDIKDARNVLTKALKSIYGHLKNGDDCRAIMTELAGGALNFVGALDD